MKKMLDKAYLVVQQLCKGTSQSTHASSAEQQVDSVQPSIVIPTKVESDVPGGHRIKSAKKVESAVPGDPTKIVESVVPGGQSAKKVESVVLGDPTKVESVVQGVRALRRWRALNRGILV